MKTMPTPSSRSVRTIAKSLSTSSEVSTAVGSSMISTRAFRLSALAISTICSRAMPSSRTRARGDTFTPTRSQEHLGVRLHPLPVDHPEAARLAPQEDVLGDREVGDEVELLVDGGDPEPLGVLRTVDAHLLAADQDPARRRGGRRRRAS